MAEEDVLDATGYEPLNEPKPVADDIWVVDGPTIPFYGMPFPTRMTLVRLQDGSLFVHSPIALDNALAEKVAALGPVGALVAPNWIHYAYLPAWQERHPNTPTFAAPGVLERAQKAGLKVRIDHTLTDVPDGRWAGQIDQRVVEGNPVHREVVFFHRASRTLILTDLIENFERPKTPRWAHPLLWVAGNHDPDGKAPIDMRWSFRLGHKGQGGAMLKAAVEQMIAWAPERVVLAHGRWYARDGVAELRRAFRWVL